MEKELLNSGKELLLKDLCARLPYGVRMFEIEPVNNIQSNLTLLSITNKESVICITPSGGVIGSSIDAFKPYLFPLSSMTKEQKEELKSLGWNFDNFEIHNVSECLGTYREYVAHSDCFALIDWLNKNHFDYRCLIEKGLAIDATGLNIYN